MSGSVLKAAWTVALIVVAGLLLVAVASWLFSVLFRLVTLLVVAGLAGLVLVTLGWLLFGGSGGDRRG
ncbi:MAG TPA: hypothetical protein VIO14_10645 [Dehalococcoidia bacterium]